MRIHHKTHLSLHSVKQCKPPALTRMNRPKSRPTARNTVRCCHDSSGRSRAILPTIDDASPQLGTTDRLSSSLGRPEPHCQTPRGAELPHSPTTCPEGHAARSRTARRQDQPQRRGFALRAVCSTTAHCTPMSMAIAARLCGEVGRLGHLTTREGLCGRSAQGEQKAAPVK